jgi:hypothetical protein
VSYNTDVGGAVGAYEQKIEDKEAGGYTTVKTTVDDQDIQR